ncbi:XRE family transcriptional regulator [Entomomonas moraniae]|uniref:XRE family transcriptional regulator n=1 Tax=Entomomonas moraniae TaxID=2213226 RepID=A0A3S9XA78_9GAMM|nr:helix-turn-helix transcriptional regulator [Entomomonas moraniae]AZS49317.1 XRE family transcriptional regulator [Entomomonas moraniae]
MNYLTVQEMIKVILSKKKYSQYSLAKEAGTSQPTINRTLKGETAPKYKLGKAIEALYNEVMSKGE